MYLFLLHYIVFNNDEWSAGFVLELDSNCISWNYQRLYRQKTEPKQLQHSLLHDLQVSQQTIESLQEALLVAEQSEQGMYKIL